MSFVPIWSITWVSSFSRIGMMIGIVIHIFSMGPREILDFHWYLHWNSLFFEAMYDRVSYNYAGPLLIETWSFFFTGWIGLFFCFGPFWLDFWGALFFVLFWKHLHLLGYSSSDTPDDAALVTLSIDHLMKFWKK